MARQVHLVRHGEVENPGHVVYAALSGFGLTERGRRQASRAARYLGSKPVVAVWSSPLNRALETAAVIARRVALPVHVDQHLLEWGLADRWAGIRWEDLPQERPGQLEAYLQHPHDLDFVDESLQALATRMTAAIEGIAARHEGDVVIVGHQDPIQTARLTLTGRGLEGLHEGKPSHASVITLRPGTSWTEVAVWAPDESDE